MKLRKKRLLLLLTAPTVLTVISWQGLAAQQPPRPMRVAADLREAPRRIFHARLEIPVTAGSLTLVYPKWIPGEHSPNGPISDLAGLKFTAGGKAIRWRRDDTDMYAFHCEIPAGAETLEVALDYLSPSAGDTIAGSPSATAQVAVLNWNQILLYPQGAKSDDVRVLASLRVPAGWRFATALVKARENEDETEFDPVSLATLVDSTVLTGAFFRTIDLAPGQPAPHRINMAGDSPAALEMSPSLVSQLKRLVAETGALFGARHYRKYDFLLALTDYVSSFGEEHHESSDNRVAERTLLDAEIFESGADLLPHEFFHSWNGKYRRPAGLVTPDYQTPMRGELLWVYEGLTQYYGEILTARSGMRTPEKFRERLAGVAAYLNQRPGRTWRNLQDTAIAAQTLYSARTEDSSWRRSVDFYDESTLIWLEADTIIRKQSKGKRSLDDFCRRFHGGQNTPPKVVPYAFEEVVAAMNEAAPYDWRTFFSQRLNSHVPGAPLGGLEASGWRLVFNSMMNEHQRAEETANRYADVQFSLGFSVYYPGGDEDSRIRDVVPGTPAGAAGIAPGMRLVAVNGRKWTPDILREAIRAAKDSKQPIELLIENEEYFKTYGLDYHGGERYPHLERDASQPDLLTDILKPLAPSAAAGN